MLLAVILLLTSLTLQGKITSTYAWPLGNRAKKMATVENCSLADRMDRVYEKD